MHKRTGIGAWLAVSVMVGACAPTSQQRGLEISNANTPTAAPSSGSATGESVAHDIPVDASAALPDLNESVDPAAPRRPFIDNAPPTVDPNRLLGGTPAAINSYLGEPTFLRLDGPALMHRYEAKVDATAADTGTAVHANGRGTCIVEVYYYKTEPGAAFRAQHVDLRRLGPDAPGENCLADFFTSGEIPLELRMLGEADSPAPHKD